MIEFLRGISGTSGNAYTSNFGGGQRTTTTLVEAINDLESTIKEQLSYRSQLTVFYSWQSDSKNSFNRGFIEDVLKKSIREVNKSSDWKLALDQDTRGENGSPDVFPTIIRKIDDALVFVADITPILKFGEKEIPNPNVMCELGYALSSLTYERVIMICNLYGCNKEKLPFDLGLKRAIFYSLSEETTTDEKQQIKKELIGKLTTAIRQIRDM